MKRAFRFVNLLMLLVTFLMTAYYDYEGGLLLKGLTGGCFVLLGIINLVYALLCKQKQLQYPVWMLLGLIVCLTGDIVINLSFLPGVGVFALGHIFYIVAFCCHQKPKWTDLIPIGLLFALALAIIKGVPSLDFGSSLVENLCIVYGLVISCMVGKAIGNFARKRNGTNFLLLIGGLLFYFSDTMLVLCHFGNGGSLADQLCIFSYFPAQSLLACSVFSWVNSRRK